MKLLILLLLVSLPIWCAAAPANETRGIQGLTLDQTIRIALTNHPHLAEAHANMEAARARASAARLESARNDIGHQLHSRERTLARALETVAVLKAEVLTKVNAVLRGAEARYSAGDISLTELIVIRREAATNQTKYLESFRSVMEAWAGLKS